MPANPAMMGTDPAFALIPAFNEADRVSATVQGARAHLPVLVVNDGSGDGTAREAEKAGASVLSLAPNRGKGAALLAGFAWALREGAAFVITLDADGQHDPAEIPRFLETYRLEPADLIIGERDFDHMPPLRRISNSVGRRVFSWSLGRDVPDNQSGYRLISRRLMEAMAQSAETGFEFEVEMIVTAVERGFTMAGVPIRTIYAGEGSHIRPLRHVVQFFRVSAATWKRRRRKSAPGSG